MKRKQVLQSTGYAGCRKHLHRTWNQFKKNFWAFSIEGTWLYTSNSTTTRNAVWRKCHLSEVQTWRPQHVAFRNLPAALSKSRLQTAHQGSQTQSRAGAWSFQSSSPLLDRTHVNTQTPEVILKTHTCQSPFYRNGHRIIIFRIWKTDTQSEGFTEEKKYQDLLQQLHNCYCNLSDRQLNIHKTLFIQQY